MGNTETHGRDLKTRNTRLLPEMGTSSMQKVRQSLARLGWPTDQMSDKQLKMELYRRWFASQPTEEMAEEAPVSIASAKGIFASLASEGNLDSLCWSEGDRIPQEEVVSEQERHFFISNPNHGQHDGAERRRSPREPARELIHWHTPWTEGEAMTGWLVNRSATGLAFIVAQEQAPEIDSEIQPCIHSRQQEEIPLGTATVVRTEPLNPELTMVCVQFDQSGQTC
jgi:hypothetical protein